MARKLGLPGLLFASVCFFGGLTGAHAEGHRPHPGGPPPEAIEACSTLAESAACSVTFHGHTLEGTCHAAPDGKGPLACRPKGPPPGPPPEAVAACSTLAESAACSVTFHGHTMAGICRAAPDGKGPLACAPAGPPPADR